MIGALIVGLPIRLVPAIRSRWLAHGHGRGVGFRRVRRLGDLRGDQRYAGNHGRDASILLAALCRLGCVHDARGTFRQAGAMEEELVPRCMTASLSCDLT